MDFIIKTIQQAWPEYHCSNLESTQARFYCAFGLTIQSPVSCPELDELDKPAALSDLSLDVVINESELDTGAFPEANRGSWFEATPGRLRFHIPGVGHFQVSDGRQIIFQRASDVADPGVTDDDVKVFLLGSCLGAVLLQRGILPLHGSTGVIDDQAVMMVGYSGAGKSTSLAALLAMGHGMLSDDVSAIDAQSGGIFVRPAYGQVKLNPDSAAKLAIEPRDLRWINRFRSKHAVLRKSSLSKAPARLTAIISLEPDDNTQQYRHEAINGTERFATVYRNAYRQLFHEGLGVTRTMVKQSIAVANQCGIYRLTRPSQGEIDTDALTRQISQILKECRG